MTVRAAVCTRYGPPEVLHIQDVPKPVPKADELLVRIDASAVTSSDCFTRSGIPTAPLAMQLSMRLLVGVRAPRRRILGLILAGKVEAVGSRVSRFAEGDRVYAFTMLRFGAWAEYACLQETSTVARAPSTLEAEEAAAIPYGGLLAWHYLRRGGLARGQSVLVYGASGAVGTSAVQLARQAGATVTAVCGPDNLELVRSLGADDVIDYTSQHVMGDERFDLVLDAVGKRKTSRLKEAARSALAPEGRYVSVDDGRPSLSSGDLEHLTTLAEAGHLRAVIDRRYPLEDIVEAHRYVEGEHKRGNVIIAVGHPDGRGTGP
jgi:NADPH:quinone reductase-like Zn-dependent oxidoreductase